MKSFNSAAALFIAAALIAGATGCKHAPPKPPTPIPQLTALPPSDRTDNTGPIRPANTGQNPNRTNPNLGESTPPGFKAGPDTGANTATLPNTGDTGIKSNPLPPLTDEQKNTQIRPEGPQDEDRKILEEDTVYFDYDKNTVKPSEVPKVQRVAAYLKNNADVTLRIEGNCDERGTEEYNRSLGERRALAIRELLVAEGVAPTRVTTLSYGEDKPADQGHDETAWSKNRRGDFVVLKAKSLQ